MNPLGYENAEIQSGKKLENVTGRKGVKLEGRKAKYTIHLVKHKTPDRDHAHASQSQGQVRAEGDAFPG
jgi:hypothetical protein